MLTKEKLGKFTKDKERQDYNTHLAKLIAIEERVAQKKVDEARRKALVHEREHAVPRDEEGDGHELRRFGGEGREDGRGGAEGGRLVGPHFREGPTLLPRGGPL